MDNLKDKSIIGIGKEVLRQEAEVLLKTADMLSSEFEKCVELILSTSGRVVVSGMGKSGHICKKIAATLASTGTPAFFLHPGEASHGDLGMMLPEDILIAISNSGNTAELTNILHYATRYGIPIIAITGNRESMLGKLSTYCLELLHLEEACPIGCAPTTSTTATLALGDALAMSLLFARGFTAEDFNKYHPGGALGKQLTSVEEIMYTGDSLPLVELDTPMADIIYTISSKGFGCAGVIDDEGKLVGIITDGDLRRHLDNNFLAKKPKDIMTKNPITIDKDIVLSQAEHLMKQKKVTVLFIINGESKPLGIINIHGLK